MKYKDALEVTIVSNGETPLDKQFGTEIGKMYIKEHLDNGVKLHLKKRVVEIKGDGKNATSVVLDDGSELPADLVIVGAGVLPATKFLEGSGIEVDQYGGVVCDPFLQTSVKDVYAAGEIASYPYWVTGKRQRIEHYVTAMN
jgi:NAD(P)H-nitrite reductase large subunit